MSDEYWLLGQRYSGKKREELDVVGDKTPSKQEFNDSLYKRILMTYQKGFSPLSPTTLTSDKGWGCMYVYY